MGVHARRHSLVNATVCTVCRPLYVRNESSNAVCANIFAQYLVVMLIALNR